MDKKIRLQLQQEIIEEEKESKEDIYENVDEKIRAVFSLQKDDEKPKQYKNISDNIPLLYQFYGGRFSRSLLILQIANAFFQSIMFWGFFVSWLTEIRSNVISYFVTFCEFALPLMTCYIVTESIWRARYHYIYLSYGVLILFDGKAWYKQRFFYLYLLLLSSMFIIGLYNDVHEWDWKQLKMTATAAGSAFVANILLIKNVLSSEESTMCKLHEFVRICSSKQQSDEIFPELLAVDETVFKAYILNRKYKMKKVINNLIQNELKNTALIPPKDYPYRFWYFNKKDIQQFMTEDENGGNIQSTRTYLDASNVKGCCGRREMFWAISG